MLCVARVKFRHHPRDDTGLHNVQFSAISRWKQKVNENERAGA
jgi:hypothetical protein